MPPPSAERASYLTQEQARHVRAWLRIPLERPLLTPAILALLVGVFVVMSIIGGSLNATDRADLLIAWGAKVGYLVYQGEWWRLLTATLLHGGILHILLNGYALFAIGSDLEALVGRGRFAAIYAVSALGGSVASFAFAPPYVLGVGASGAIFGLIGALAVYLGLHRRLFGRMGQAQFWNIIAIIVLNMGLGFSGIFPIDNSAHLGGLVAGAAVGYVLCPRYALGDWLAPNIRSIININRGPLPWLAAGLITLDVILAFFVTLLLFRAGIIPAS